MADNASLPLVGSMDEYPSTNTPVIYTDGITSANPGPHIVKANFAKIDASTLKVGEYEVKIILQIVMPTDAFIQTAQYMTNVVNSMIAGGHLTTEMVERIRLTAGGRIDGDK